MLVIANARRLEQGVFGRPAVIQPLLYSAVFDRGYICPFSHRLDLSSTCNQAVVLAVAILFFVSSPSAVFGCVAFGSVNAVECQTFGAISHVADKSTQIMPPTQAHTDSLGSVFKEAGIFGIVATLNHVPPDAKIGMFSQPVSGHLLSSDLRCAATAALTYAVINQVATNAAFISAETAANPIMLAVFNSIVLEDGPASRMSSNQVYVGHAPEHAPTYPTCQVGNCPRIL